MNKDKYPRYGLALIVGGGLALWAGLPPVLLLVLVVCPLMMFFMMRGMHGGQDHGSHEDATYAGSKAPPASDPAETRRLDGSHERIDHP